MMESEIKEWNIIDDRRGAPRHKVRLLSAISPVAPPVSTGQDSTLPTLIGHTHDLSRTGLAIEVPTNRINGQALDETRSPVSILLDLDTERIKLEARPVHCRPLPEASEGYLIGVQVTKTKDKNWPRYVKYVYGLH